MTYSEYAKQFIGAQEGDSIHHQIIDGYNKIKPLPRGYAVSYTDAWCAAFVSFVEPLKIFMNAVYRKCITKHISRTLLLKIHLSMI